MKDIHFDICSRNHRGNDNSKSSNLVTPKNRDTERIMEYLGSVADATCDETEMALGMTHQTCSARFSELKMDGCILPTTKRPTRTGCAAQAFKKS